MARNQDIVRHLADVFSDNRWIIVRLEASRLQRLHRRGYFLRDNLGRLLGSQLSAMKNMRQLNAHGLHFPCEVLDIIYTLL